MPHNGPIKSRIEVFCQECGNDFEAKRVDSKYCPTCRKIVNARLTKESAERNREQRNAQSRERFRRRTAEQRAQKLEQLRKKYQTDEEYRESRKQFAREWSRIHGGSHSASAERRQKYSRDYYDAHKEEHNEKRVNRQKAQNYRDDVCGVCGIDDSRVLVVHHKLPLSKGGTSDQSNLQTLCRNCHAVAHWEDKT